MKKLITQLMVLSVIFTLSACTSTKEVTQSKNVQPNNIDKNNVGITSSEDADQTDPTLIEGNLEDNDFKN